VAYALVSSALPMFASLLKLLHHTTQEIKNNCCGQIITVISQILFHKIKIIRSIFGIYRGKVITTE
jgi:hypothetical protein